jgi:hypothetical protein
MRRGVRRTLGVWRTLPIVLLSGALAGCGRGDAPVDAARREPVAPVTRQQVYRVSTAVPFPRGLVMKDEALYVLARGRVRESGGADGAIDDKAGTIYVIDPNVSEPVTSGTVSQAVRGNASVFAEPTEPPFKLFDRSARPATRDRETDRPYCTLRYDEATKNFYICAFSGIDKADAGTGSVFSKNTNDAVMRYDTRTKRWYDVERHSLEAGGNYPHHDPATRAPPHGWLNGPDNCLLVGRWLYCVAKDNSLLVAYDLREVAHNADAPPPPARWILDSNLMIKGQGVRQFHGHSMLAERDGYLYVGYRTSSVIVRVALGEDGLPKAPIEGELVARFDPWDPATRKSANLTDMAFGPEGDLYVISAQPARVYRFRPDPTNVFDAREGKTAPWADLARLTDNARMKSENVLVDAGGNVFVTSGDAYDFQYGSGGTVYKIVP